MEPGSVPHLPLVDLQKGGGEEREGLKQVGGRGFLGTLDSAKQSV
jgi:hypothetical protein